MRIVRSLIVHEETLIERSTKPKDEYDKYCWIVHPLPDRSRGRRSIVRLFSSKWLKIDLSNSQASEFWFIPREGHDFCIHFLSPNPSPERVRFLQSIRQCTEINDIEEDTLEPTEHEYYWRLLEGRQYAGPMVAAAAEVRPQLKVVRGSQPTVILEWTREEVTVTPDPVSDEPVGDIRWRELSYVGLQRHIENLKQTGQADEDRLARAERLIFIRTQRPITWWRGVESNSTNSYLVAQFLNCAIAEAGCYGNALYALPSTSIEDWQDVFCLTPREITAKGGIAIRHIGEWRERVKRIIRGEVGSRPIRRKP